MELEEVVCCERQLVRKISTYSTNYGRGRGMKKSIAWYVNINERFFINACFRDEDYAGRVS